MHADDLFRRDMTEHRDLRLGRRLKWFLDNQSTCNLRESSGPADEDLFRRKESTDQVREETKTT